MGVIRRPDITGFYAAQHPTPEELPPGHLVVVRDGGREKVACFLCPGGCGQKIVLSMFHNRHSRWRVRFDWLGRPTVSPSVRQLGKCQCHYWIHAGAVAWCADSGHDRPR